MLAAAREVFAERGYASARTREIARRAQATEKMVFRHFPSKVALFREAVFEPFSKVAESYLDEFENRARLGLGAETLARDYVVCLYEFLRDNRLNILSLLAAYAHDPQVLGSGVDGPLERLIDELVRAVEVGVAEQGRDAADARQIVRLTFGMVLSAAVTNPLLLGPDEGAEDALVDEIVRYVIAGVLRRDPLDCGIPPRVHDPSAVISATSAPTS
ncbi:TetR/AcrR family transcriptional regulator [Actinomadura physcomitrii]|uniref:TetR/AcrR family transcriptional regulator n=1 Tax=Actinomadura physcomitrii TaxID=2650748 RepID=UPI00137184E6|nr:TetR/AcrR family transcriptional regulator [Actinomadura physcomitrii]